MRITFDETGPKLKESQLVSFEKSLLEKLPDEYRAFLLRTNGGVTEDDLTFAFSDDGCATDTVVGEFYALAEDIELMTLAEGIETFVTSERMPAWFLPIADDAFGNQLCLSLSSDDYGTVYFWNHEREDTPDRAVSLVAESFAAFLARLKKLED